MTYTMKMFFNHYFPVHEFSTPAKFPHCIITWFILTLSPPENICIHVYILVYYNNWVKDLYILMTITKYNTIYHYLYFITP